MGMVQEGKIFVDRRDAGYELGKLLEKEYKGKGVLVLGIPRGGVVVAYEVAQVLNGQLSVVITKKLPHPSQEELAVGAIAEDGSVYLTQAGRQLSTDILNAIIKEQWAEIQSRIQRFRQGKPLPAMDDRTIILVDDGIATGSTLVPAIQLCKNRGAARVVVAAPVAGKDLLPEIRTLANDVVIVGQPENFYAVGQVYNDFHHLSDEEVISLLEDFEGTKR